MLLHIIYTDVILEQIDERQEDAHEFLAGILQSLKSNSPRRITCGITRYPSYICTYHLLLYV